MKAVEAYKLYLAIKMHFETNYDFFKYNGKIKSGNLDNRRDKYQFVKLTKIVNDEDMKDFLVANFAYSTSDNLWIGNILNDEGKNAWLKYKKFLEAYTYIFSQELNSLLESVEDIDMLVKVTNGQDPLIIRQLYAGKVSLETFTLFTIYSKILDYWDRELSDTIMWPKWKRKVIKLYPFLNIDHSKIKLIFKEKMLAKAHI